MAAANNGIFIRSTKSNDEIIKACKDLVKKFGAEIAFTDEAHEGLKVYINSDSVVQELINKGYLDETEDSTIHPLTTQLIVRGVKVEKKKEEIIEDLQIKIQDKLGNKKSSMQVLEISNIPSSEEHADVLSVNWRVILDAPDIEVLDEFKKIALLHNFTVLLMGMKKELPVNFYCNRCKKDGHIRSGCKENQRNNTSKKMASSSPKSSPNRSNTTIPQYFEPKIKASISMLGSSTTSHNPASTEGTMTPEALPSNPGPSTSGINSDLSQMKHGSKGNVIIPECIKDIILRTKNPVLDLIKLQSFFNEAKHTHKQKSGNVAESYTKDVTGLRKQLQGIVKKQRRIEKNKNYPMKGKKDVNGFMLWLDKLIKRLKVTRSTFF